MTQPLPGAQAVNVENELDIRGLFRALWAGKGWIVGGAVLFAAIVLVYTFFCSPGVERHGDHRSAYCQYVGGYYSQQQFLRNLDIKADLASVDQPSAMDEAYKEFIMQLASWDTRRDFWLQTDYYKQRQSGNARADAAMLDDLINNIQFMPGDAAKSINDSVKLTAETGQDANNLLRQYVAFASQRAAGHLNDELKGAWAARTVQMKAQVKRRGRGGRGHLQPSDAQRGAGAEGGPAAQYFTQRNGCSCRSVAGFRAIFIGQADAAGQAGKPAGRRAGI
ncbi:ECA polysaccharide chain length modulation protein [Klebsiella variicola subsp. variicola]|nr:ECA polysaccharide chain length modulation protein [Klebsiella variicola subsp. variicola]